MSSTMKQHAQIQLGESIFAVIIILFIIIFMLIFYTNSEEQEFSKRQTTFANLASISLAQFIGSFPELGCSEREVQDISCFDMQKLDAFITLLEQNPSLTEEYYATQLGTVTIVIKELYPEKNTWVLYNNSLNTSFADVRQVQQPVSLRNSITREHSFGVLYLTLYDRR